MNMIKISELSYADDIVIIAKTGTDRQYNLEIFHQELEQINMKINKDNTKTMVISKQKKEQAVTLGNTTLEQIENFK